MTNCRHNAEESECIVAECRARGLAQKLESMTADRDQARKTAEFWKANHLAGNEEIKRLELQVRECAHALGLALTHGHPPTEMDLRIKFESGWAIYRMLLEQGVFLDKRAESPKPLDKNRCYCCGTEHCKMCGKEPCKGECRKS